MTQSAVTFYSSSNGDRWQLVTDAESGLHLVRHEPALASGGQSSEVEVPEFLSRTGSTPQGEALRQLLAERGVTDMEDE
ncbi:MAG: hypothetical protein U1E70_18185 [Acetobacteraceae bacterium]